jgi:hypothetical protein
MKPASQMGWTGARRGRLIGASGIGRGVVAHPKDQRTRRGRDAAGTAVGRRSALRGLVSGASVVPAAGRWPNASSSAQGAWSANSARARRASP